jgi:hydroxylaminobenzene mutase
MEIRAVLQHLPKDVGWLIAGPERAFGASADINMIESEGITGWHRVHSQEEALMNASDTLSRQGHRLLQLGIILFLFTSFEGFAVPYLMVPNLGRSVHTLSGFTGVLFLAMGLMWPMLKLGTTASNIAFWFLVYSAFATITGFIVAALWGAGGSIMPIAAQGARGSEFQEAVIQAVMYPAAPTGIISFVLILWGLGQPHR